MVCRLLLIIVTSTSNKFQSNPNSLRANRVRNLIVGIKELSTNLSSPISRDLGFNKDEHYRLMS